MEERDAAATTEHLYTSAELARYLDRMMAGEGVKAPASFTWAPMMRPGELAGEDSANP